MADPRYPYWLQDMSPEHRGPTTAGVVRLAVLLLLVVLAWSWFSDTESGAAQVDRRPGVSLCEEHAGKPGWSAVCAPQSDREPTSAKR